MSSKNKKTAIYEPSLFSITALFRLFSGQIRIFPKPEFLVHFGGTLPLLFTTIWGNSQPAGKVAMKFAQLNMSTPS